MDSGWAVFVEGHENTEDKNIPSKRKQGLIQVQLIDEQKYDENDDKKKIQDTRPKPWRVLP